MTAGLPAGAWPGPSFAAIDAYVRTQMKDGVHAADSVFIGSNSRSFTAVAVMQLAEAGKVDLDAPVQRYIPRFRVADPRASALITVRHLLNRTSGLSPPARRLSTPTSTTRCWGWLWRWQAENHSRLT